jgi:hypothetical protein
VPVILETPNMPDRMENEIAKVRMAMPTIRKSALGDPSRRVADEQRPTAWFSERLRFNG